MFLASVVFFTGAVGCCAVAANEQSSDQSPGPPQVQSIADADDYFGSITYGDWAGTIAGNGDSVEFRLHWIEAGYTDYDIDQSRNKFAGQGEIVGVVTLPDRHITIFGKRRTSTQLLCVDVGLLVDEDRLTADWPDLVEHIKQVNLSGGMDSKEQCGIVLKSEDGLRIELFLSKHQAAGFSVEAAPPIMISEIASPSDAVQRFTWVGTSKDGEDTTYPTRLAVLQVGPGDALSDPIASVSIFTVRQPQRRLAGEVSPDSPWTSRAQFVHTLLAMQDAEIDWYSGEFNEEASRIVERFTRRKLDKEAFFHHLEATFGSRGEAALACCPFPEVTHMPMAKFESGEGDRFVGTRWRETFYRRIRRMNARAFRTSVPSTTSETCAVQWWISYIPEQAGQFELNHFDGFPVQLRMLPRP